MHTQKPAKQRIIRSLTVLIPAFNEEDSIADSIISLQHQTAVPGRIIVIDDCSTDHTAEIARDLGVEVLTPEQNTGSKAGAQNLALKQVTSTYVMAIDADTILETHAIARLMRAMVDRHTAAACGFVLPRYVKTLWERGRYIEYLLAFTYYKPIQDYYHKPLIASGCFSVYRTKILQGLGGWPTRTMAEDMDLTWTMYKHGHKIRFMEKAESYPIEPTNFTFMAKQLKRWTHGFIQNIRLHRNINPQIPFLNISTSVAAWDGIVSSFVFTITIPLLALYYRQPLILLLYVADLPLIVPPLSYQALKRGEAGKIIASIPSYIVLRTVNAYFMVEAFISEVILGRRLTTYEKGH